MLVAYWLFAGYLQSHIYIATFLVIIVVSTQFPQFALLINGPAGGPTDPSTDMPLFGDEWRHLKKKKKRKIERK